MGGVLTHIKEAWKRLLSQKGQGLTEFALVLAFCASIAWMADSGGFRNAINAVIASGRQDEQYSAAIGSANTNLYAAMFNEMRVTGKDKLISLYSNEARVDADLSGLQNIADALIGMNEKDFLKLINSDQWKDGTRVGYEIMYYRDKEGYYGENTADKYHYSASKDGAKTQTGTEFNTNMVSLMLGDDNYNFVTEFGRTDKGDNWGSWKSERYFYSDGMVNDQNGKGGGDVESRIRAQIQMDDNKNITGVHIYVRSDGGKKYYNEGFVNGKEVKKSDGNISTAEQNEVLKRTGSDGKSNLYDGVYAGTVSDSTKEYWKKNAKSAN